MKVLMISGSLPPVKCGVGFYTSRLLGRLKDQHIEFEVLSTQGVSHNFLGKEIQRIDDWKIRRLPRMLGTVRQSGADIVHVQYPTVPYRRQMGINLLPLFIRLSRPKIKIVVTLHEYHGSGLLGKIRSRLTVWPAHRVIVSNLWDQKELPWSIKNRSQIIPIGSNLDKAAPDPELYRRVMKDNGLSPERPTLLFFGFAYPNKGLDNLIGAIAQTKLDDWQLLMLCGLEKNNSYHNNLLDMLDKVNSSGKRAAATGFLPDEQVSVILQEGKYFILPQPLPLTAKSSTAIAAVQHGLVVVSKAGHVASLQAPFRDKVNSRLLPVVTPSDLADAVAELESNPAELKSISFGREKLQSYFSWQSIAKGHIDLYKELS